MESKEGRGTPIGEQTDGLDRPLWSDSPPEGDGV